MTEYHLLPTLHAGVVQRERLGLALNESTDEEDAQPQPDQGYLRVAFSRYDEFLEALEKVNKKAAQYNVPPLKVLKKTKVDVTPGAKTFDGVDYNNDVKKQFEWHIEMESNPVRINGWEFLASVEHGGKDGANVLRFVPGLEDPRVKQYANASNHNCDFCHSNRDRNNTYIVRNVESGDLKQVGGQCLQKYIGDAARKLAKFAFSMSGILQDMADEDGREGSRGRRSVPMSDVNTTLAAAVVAIKEYGFVKASGYDESDKMPTATLVRAAVFNEYSPEFYKEWKDVLQKMSHPDADAVKQVEEILTWFNSLPEAEKESSYMMSLESIINADMVSGRSIGLLTSLPAVYHRTMHGRKEREQQAVSNWQGAIGQKIPSTKVKTVYTSMQQGDYGSYQIVKFRDEAGNIYTWFNTSSRTLDDDTEYTIVGKVKKHDEYKGVKNTVLTHVKAT